jgi:hypothetical protein
MSTCLRAARRPAQLLAAMQARSARRRVRAIYGPRRSRTSEATKDSVRLRDVSHEHETRCAAWLIRGALLLSDRLNWTTHDSPYSISFQTPMAGTPDSQIQRAPSSGKRPEDDELQVKPHVIVWVLGPRQGKLRDGIQRL